MAVGAMLANPYEFAILSSGSLESGLDFASTITAQLAFVAFGTLAASLAFSATLGDYTQRLEVIFEDDFFDDQPLLAKVNYDICQLIDVIQSLLGKLGSLAVSPESILGPSALSGIDFFSSGNGTGSLDGLFPDVAPVSASYHSFS